MRTYFEEISGSPQVRALVSALGSGGRFEAVGAAGSSTHLVAGAIARLSGRLVVLVVAHIDDADEAVDELESVGVAAARLPALEVLPGESAVSLELFAERLQIVRRLTDAPEKGVGVLEVLVCAIPALMQGVPEAGRIGGLCLTLAPGDSRGREAIVRWLDAAGFRRVDSIEEPGEFAVRGGILDIFPAAQPQDAPIRLDFFGDELESIREIDLETLGSGGALGRAEIIGAGVEHFGLEEGSVSPLEIVPGSAVAIVAEMLEVTEQGRGYFERVTDTRGIEGPPGVLRRLRERFAWYLEVNQFTAGSAPGEGVVELPARVLPEFARDAEGAVREVGEMARRGRVVVVCENEGERQRFGEMLGEYWADAAAGAVECRVGRLHRGFLWNFEGCAGGDGGVGGGLALAPYHELMHRYQSRRRIRRLKVGRAADTFLEINPGDFVVHADHGVGQFVGLRTLKARTIKPTAQERTVALNRAARTEGKGGGEGIGEEYLTVAFAGGSKLHVPVSQIDKVQKYVGGYRGKPPLSTLGGKRWQAQKQSVRESVRDLAAELLRVQAARENMAGVRFPEDTSWQGEFEAEFPYQETEDQIAALGEVKHDMCRGRPMDRLLCGDVGYGKTEVAIRASFKAVEFGKQVAVLVPTTLLAEQHERTFRERFADYPFRVESLSRFRTTKEQNEILAATRRGAVDILIGTHRILSKDVRFADLGLVVVDEEQRFGVEHKNALLALRMTVDVLTLSATPIPRTLHMSMLGLRDISSLSTPPLDRRAVVTEILPYNERRIAQAIGRELAREGQVYFVHNRVHNIRSVADEVQRLAPGARIVVGHGQMPDGELEEVMRRFVGRGADILVSTTIIESGIDIPTANTMFINGADRFGLAELHQLRGRVGRHKHRAYCYLLLAPDRPLTDIAARRLRAIEEFSMLGAGFKISMRDLEIRGAGNILGPEQSGHIAAVGYDMYCRLLDQAAKELGREGRAESGETTIEIGASGSFPKAYIPSEARRLEAYRRLASAHSQEELTAVEHDLGQAYGEAPSQAQTLLELAWLRIGATALGVRSIARHDQDVIMRCVDPGPVVEAMGPAKGTVRPLTLRAGEILHEVYYRPPAAYLEPRSLLTVLRRHLAGEVGNHQIAKGQMAKGVDRR